LQLESSKIQPSAS